MQPSVAVSASPLVSKISHDVSASSAGDVNAGSFASAGDVNGSPPKELPQGPLADLGEELAARSKAMASLWDSRQPATDLSSCSPLADLKVTPKESTSVASAAAAAAAAADHFRAVAQDVLGSSKLRLNAVGKTNLPNVELQSRTDVGVVMHSETQWLQQPGRIPVPAVKAEEMMQTLSQLAATEEYIQPSPEQKDLNTSRALSVTNQKLRSMCSALAGMVVAHEAASKDAQEICGEVATLRAAAEAQANRAVSCAAEADAADAELQRLRSAGATMANKAAELKAQAETISAVAVAQDVLVTDLESGMQAFMNQIGVSDPSSPPKTSLKMQMSLEGQYTHAIAPQVNIQRDAKGSYAVNPGASEKELLSFSTHVSAGCGLNSPKSKHAVVPNDVVAEMSKLREQVANMQQALFAKDARIRDLEASSNRVQATILQHGQLGPGTPVLTVQPHIQSPLLSQSSQPSKAGVSGHSQVMAPYSPLQSLAQPLPQFCHGSSSRSVSPAMWPVSSQTHIGSESANLSKALSSAGVAVHAQGGNTSSGVRAPTSSTEAAQSKQREGSGSRSRSSSPVRNALQMSLPLVEQRTPPSTSHSSAPSVSSAVLLPTGRTGLSQGIPGSSSQIGRLSSGPLPIGSSSSAFVDTVPLTSSTVLLDTSPRTSPLTVGNGGNPVVAGRGTGDANASFSFGPSAEVGGDNSAFPRSSTSPFLPQSADHKGDSIEEESADIATSDFSKVIQALLEDVAKDQNNQVKEASEKARKDHAMPAMVSSVGTRVKGPLGPTVLSASVPNLHAHLTITPRAPNSHVFNSGSFGPGPITPRLTARATPASPAEQGLGQPVTVGQSNTGAPENRTPASRPNSVGPRPTTNAPSMHLSWQPQLCTSGRQLQSFSAQPMAYQQMIPPWQQLSAQRQGPLLRSASGSVRMKTTQPQALGSVEIPSAQKSMSRATSSPPIGASGEYPVAVHMTNCVPKTNIDPPPGGSSNPAVHMTNCAPKTNIDPPPGGSFIGGLAERVPIDFSRDFSLTSPLQHTMSTLPSRSYVPSSPTDAPTRAPTQSQTPATPLNAPVQNKLPDAMQLIASARKDSH